MFWTGRTFALFFAFPKLEGFARSNSIKSVSFLLTVGEIWEAFSLLSDGEFEAKYGFAKPGPEQDMVLHCLKGKRALDASDKLSLLGYTKVKVYRGSFSEWKEKGGEVLTQ